MHRQKLIDNLAELGYTLRWAMHSSRGVWLLGPTGRPACEESYTTFEDAYREGWRCKLIHADIVDRSTRAAIRWARRCEVARAHLRQWAESDAGTYVPDHILMDINAPYIFRSWRPRLTRHRQKELASSLWDTWQHPEWVRLLHWFVDEEAKVLGHRTPAPPIGSLPARRL